MTLGEKLLKLRRERGMSQDELAEKLDVSRQAISKWERDEAIPETEKIIRIAQEFGVSTDHLLMNQETPSPESRPWQVPPQEPSAGQQILRGVRRHGYKAGYVMMFCGVAVCVISVLILLLLPAMGSGVFDMADGFTNSAGSMIESSGFGAAGGMFDGVFGIFNQQVDQMENMWHNSLKNMALMISVPLLLVGIGLLIGGIVIIFKGKRWQNLSHNPPA